MAKVILLADDSATIQKVVRISLHGEGYELITVDNGIDALKTARNIKPDLIFADITMPGMDGYELCREIRLDRELKNVPVILLAGNFEKLDEDKNKAAGADGVLNKPFTSADFLKKIKEFL